MPAPAGNVLTLDVTNDDLQEYIKADYFRLRIRATTVQLLTADQRIGISARFFVDARILGI